MIKKIVKKITSLYWRIQNPIKYAQHLGVSIGNNCFIATRNWSSEPYLITIGNNVQVTKDVYFHTHGGSHAARTIIPDFDVFGKIVIEDGAYIGSGSHIMPGVTIGKSALIAAGSIVTHSVPAFEVWGGVPAREITTIAEFIAHNQKYNLGTHGLSQDKKRLMLLSLSDDHLKKNKYSRTICTDSLKDQVQITTRQ